MRKSLVSTSKRSMDFCPGLLRISNHSLFVILILLTSIHRALGDVFVSVELLNLKNPNGTNAVGLCCNDNCQSCDYIFQICLEPGTSSTCSDPSAVWQYDLGSSSVEVLSFPLTDQNGLSNTMAEIVGKTWQGFMPIKVIVSDYQFGSDPELVDVLTGTVAIPAGRNISEAARTEITLTGTRIKSAPTEMQVSVAVYCASKYYGIDCSVHCHPQDDCGGHFICDSESGAILCRDNWTGDTCQIATEKMCSPGPGTEIWGHVYLGTTSCSDNNTLSVKINMTEKLQISGDVYVPTFVEYSFEAGETAAYSLIVSVHNHSTEGSSYIVFFSSGIWVRQPPGALQLSLNAGWNSTHGLLIKSISVGRIVCLPFSANFIVAEEFCHNGGICMGPTLAEAVCCCSEGYFGKKCEYYQGDCPMDYCNGGLCYEEDGEYLCQCPQGSTGETCSLVSGPVECDKESCVTKCNCSETDFHGGCTCAALGKIESRSHTTTCAANYHGLGCNVFCLASDECSGHFRCICETGERKCRRGWIGPNCDKVDANDPIPAHVCPDTSDCNAPVSGFCFKRTCCCNVGFTGEFCEENIDDCDPNPCQNDASCQDGINSFTCQCQPGFTGELCDEPTTEKTTMETVPVTEELSSQAAMFTTEEDFVFSSLAAEGFTSTSVPESTQASSEFTAIATEGSSLEVTSGMTSMASIELSSGYTFQTTEVSTELSSDFTSVPSTEMTSEFSSEMTSEFISEESSSEMTSEFSSEVTTEFSSEMTSELISEMTTESSSEMTSEFSSEMTTEASSEMTTESSSEMTTESSSEMTTEASSEMTTEASSEMTTESSSEFSSEMTTEASSEMTTESSSEMSSESSSEMTSELSSEMTTESSSEMSSESSSEMTSEFSSEMTTESSSEMSSESSSEMTSEFSSEMTTESSSEMSSESSSEMTSEFSSEMTTESSSEMSSESSSEMTSEFSSEVTTEFSSEMTSEMTTIPTTDFSTELTSDATSVISTEFSTDVTSDFTFDQTTMFETTFESSATTEYSATTDSCLDCDSNTFEASLVGNLGARTDEELLAIFNDSQSNLRMEPPDASSLVSLTINIGGEVLDVEDVSLTVSLQSDGRMVSTIRITLAETPTVDVSEVISGSKVAETLGIDFEEPDGEVFDILFTGAILLEGVFLDVESYGEYAEAFKSAYEASNAELASGNLEILVLRTAEVFTDNGVQVTKFTIGMKLDNTIVNVTEYSLDSSNLVSAFLEKGYVGKAYNGSGEFDVTESFSVILQGASVFKEDFDLIGPALETIWQQVNAEYTVKVTSVESYTLLVDSEPISINRLIYFVMDADGMPISSSDLLLEQPTVEDLVPAIASVKLVSGATVELNVNATKSALLNIRTQESIQTQSIDTGEGVAFRSREAFNVFLEGRITSATFLDLADAFTPLFAEVYAGATIKVVDSIEMVTLSGTIVSQVEMFVISAEGQVIDARRIEALQPGLEVIQEIGSKVTLPDGSALSFVAMNISLTETFDSVTAIPRKSLFSQVIQGSFPLQNEQTVVGIFKAALISTYTEATESSVTVDLIRAEECFNMNSGRDVTNLLFLVTVVNIETGITAILDPSLVFSSQVSAATFSAEASSVEGFDFMIFTGIISTLARADDLTFLYFGDVLLEAEFSSLELSFTSLVEGKIQSASNVSGVEVTLATIQEARTSEGKAVYACGLLVEANDKVVIPSAIEIVTIGELEASIQITNARGEVYGLITEDIEAVVRISNMFYFGLTTSIALSSYTEIETAIVTILKSTRDDFVSAEVVVTITSVTEYVTADRETVFIVFYTLFVDGVMATSRTDVGLSFSDLTTVFSNLVAPSGVAYSLIDVGVISSSVSATSTLVSTARTASLVCNVAVSSSQYESFSAAIKTSVVEAIETSASFVGSVVASDITVTILRMTEVFVTETLSTSFALDFTVSIKDTACSLGVLPDLNNETILAELPAPINGGTYIISVVSVASSVAISSVQSSVTTMNFDLAFAIAFEVEVQASLFASVERRLESQFVAENNEVTITEVKITVLGVQEQINLETRMSIFNLFYMVKVAKEITDARVYPSIDVVDLNKDLDFFDIKDISGRVLVSQTAVVVRSTSSEVTAIRRSECSQLVLSGSVSQFDIEVIQQTLTSIVQDTSADVTVLIVQRQFSFTITGEKTTAIFYAQISASGSVVSPDIGVSIGADTLNAELTGVTFSSGQNYEALDVFVSVRVTASLTVAAAVYLEERDAFSFTLTRQVIEDDLSTLQVNLLNALSTVSDFSLLDQLTVQIANQKEIITATGELVFVIQYFAYSVVSTSVTGSITTEVLVVASSRTFSALSANDASVALELTISGSTETYASLVFEGSIENSIAVETSVQVTFTETISTTAYTELEGLFLDAMVAVDSVYSGFSVTIALIESQFTAEGQEVFTVMCGVENDLGEPAVNFDLNPVPVSLLVDTLNAAGFTFASGSAVTLNAVVDTTSSTLLRPSQLFQLGLRISVSPLDVPRLEAAFVEAYKASLGISLSVSVSIKIITQIEFLDSSGSSIFNQMCQVTADGELQIPGLQVPVSDSATAAALGSVTISGLSISFYDAIVPGFTATSSSFINAALAFTIPFTGFVPISIIGDLELSILDFLGGLPGLNGFGIPGVDWGISFFGQNLGFAGGISGVMCPIGISLTGGGFIDFRSFGGLDIDLNGLVAAFGAFPSLSGLSIKFDFNPALAVTSSRSLDLFFLNKLVLADIELILTAVKAEFASLGALYAEIQLEVFGGAIEIVASSGATVSKLEVFQFLNGQTISQPLSFYIIVQITAGITTFYGEPLVATQASADVQLIQFEQMYTIAFNVKVLPDDYTEILDGLISAWETEFTGRVEIKIFRQETVFDISGTVYYMLIFTVALDDALMDARLYLPITLTVIRQELSLIFASIDYDEVLFMGDISSLARKSQLGFFFIDSPIDSSLLAHFSAALVPVWLQLFPEAVDAYITVFGMEEYIFIRGFIQTFVYCVYYEVQSSVEVIYPDFNSPFIEALQATLNIISVTGSKISVVNVLSDEVALRSSLFSLKGLIYVAYEDNPSVKEAMQSAWSEELREAVEVILVFQNLGFDIEGNAVYQWMHSVSINGSLIDASVNNMLWYFPELEDIQASNSETYENYQDALIVNQDVEVINLAMAFKLYFITDIATFYFVKLEGVLSAIWSSSFENGTSYNCKLLATERVTDSAGVIGWQLNYFVFEEENILDARLIPSIVMEQSNISSESDLAHLQLWDTFEDPVLHVNLMASLAVLGQVAFSRNEEFQLAIELAWQTSTNLTDVAIVFGKQSEIICFGATATSVNYLLELEGVTLVPGVLPQPPNYRILEELGGGLSLCTDSPEYLLHYDDAFNFYLAIPVAAMDKESVEVAIMSVWERAMDPFKLFKTFSVKIIKQEVIVDVNGVFGYKISYTLRADDELYPATGLQHILPSVNMSFALSTIPLLLGVQTYYDFSYSGNLSATFRFEDLTSVIFGNILSQTQLPSLGPIFLRLHTEQNFEVESGTLVEVLALDTCFTEYGREVYVISYCIKDSNARLLRRIDVPQLGADTLENELLAEDFLTIKETFVEVIALTSVEVFRKVDMFVITLEFFLGPLDFAEFQNTFLEALVDAFPELQDFSLSCKVMFQESVISQNGVSGVNLYIRVMSTSSVISSEIYGQLSVSQLITAFGSLTVTGGTDVISDSIIDMSVTLYAINTLLPIFTTAVVPAEVGEKLLNILISELQVKYSVSDVINGATLNCSLLSQKEVFVLADGSVTVMMLFLITANDEPVDYRLLPNFDFETLLATIAEDVELASAITIIPDLTTESVINLDYAITLYFSNKVVVQDTSVLANVARLCIIQMAEEHPDENVPDFNFVDIELVGIEDFITEEGKGIFGAQFIFLLDGKPFKQSLSHICLKSFLSSLTSSEGVKFSVYKPSYGVRLFHYDRLFFVTLTAKVKRVDHDAFYDAVLSSWNAIQPDVNVLFLTQEEALSNTNQRVVLWVFALLTNTNITLDSRVLGQLPLDQLIMEVRSVLITGSLIPGESYVAKILTSSDVGMKIERKTNLCMVVSKQAFTNLDIFAGFLNMTIIQLKPGLSDVDIEVYGQEEFIWKVNSRVLYGLYYKLTSRGNLNACPPFDHTFIEVLSSFTTQLSVKGEKYTYIEYQLSYLFPKRKSFRFYLDSVIRTMNIKDIEEAILIGFRQGPIFEVGSSDTLTTMLSLQEEMVSLVDRQMVYRIHVFMSLNGNLLDAEMEVPFSSELVESILDSVQVYLSDQLYSDLMHSGNVSALVGYSKRLVVNLEMDVADDLKNTSPYIDVFDFEDPLAILWNEIYRPDASALIRIIIIKEDEAHDSSGSNLAFQITYFLTVNGVVIDGNVVSPDHLLIITEGLNMISLEGPRGKYILAGNDTELPVSRLNLGVHVYFDKPVEEDIYNKLESNFASLYLYKYGISVTCKITYKEKYIYEIGYKIRDPRNGQLLVYQVFMAGALVNPNMLPPVPYKKIIINSEEYNPLDKTEVYRYRYLFYVLLKVSVFSEDVDVIIDNLKEQWSTKITDASPSVVYSGQEEGQTETKLYIFKFNYFLRVSSDSVEVILNPSNYEKLSNDMLESAFDVRLQGSPETYSRQLIFDDKGITVFDELLKVDFRWNGGPEMYPEMENRVKNYWRGSRRKRSLDDVKLHSIQDVIDDEGDMIQRAYYEVRRGNKLVDITMEKSPPPVDWLSVLTPLTISGKTLDIFVGTDAPLPLHKYFSIVTLIPLKKSHLPGVLNNIEGIWQLKCGTDAAKPRIISTSQQEQIINSESVFMLYYVLDTCNAVNTPNLGVSEQVGALQLTEKDLKASDVVNVTHTNTGLLYDELSFVVTKTWVDPVDYNVVASVLEDAYHHLGRSIIVRIEKEDEYITRNRTYLYKLLYSVWDNGAFVRRNLLPVISPDDVNLLKDLSTMSGRSLDIIEVDEASLRRVEKGLSVKFDKWISADDRPLVLMTIQRTLQNQMSDVTVSDAVQEYLVSPNKTYYVNFMVWVYQGRQEVDTRYFDPLDAIISENMKSEGMYDVHTIAPQEVARAQNFRFTYNLYVENQLPSSEIRKFHAALSNAWQVKSTNRSIQIVDTFEYIGHKGKPVTGISYFVLEHGKPVKYSDSEIDPELIQVQSSNVLDTYRIYPSSGLYDYSRIYSLHLKTPLTVADAGSLEKLLLNVWRTEEKLTNQTVKVSLLNVEIGFGEFGAQVTKVVYSVLVNGLALFPQEMMVDDEKLQRAFREIHGFEMYRSDQEPMRSSLTFTIKFNGSVDKKTKPVVESALLDAWKLQYDNLHDVHLAIVGREVAVRDDLSKMVDIIHYQIYKDGEALRPVDFPAPNNDAMDRSFRRNDLDLNTYKGSTIPVHTLDLAPDSQDILPQELLHVLQSAIKSAWLKTNISSEDEVTIHILTDTNYANEAWSEVSHIEYAVLVNGENVEFVWDSPSQKDIDIQLGEAVKIHNQNIHPVRATYVKGYVAGSQREELPDLIVDAWHQANADVPRELFEVVVQPSVPHRRKRSVDHDVTSFEDTTGRPLTEIKFLITLEGLDPDPLFVQEPNDALLNRQLSAIGLEINESPPMRCLQVMLLNDSIREIDLIEAIADVLVVSNVDIIRNDIEVTWSILDGPFKGKHGVEDIILGQYCVHRKDGGLLAALRKPSQSVLREKLHNAGFIVHNDLSSLLDKLKFWVVPVVAVCLTVAVIIVTLIAIKVWLQSRLEKKKADVPGENSFLGHGLFKDNMYRKPDCQSGMYTNPKAKDVEMELGENNEYFYFWNDQ